MANQQHASGEAAELAVLRERCKSLEAQLAQQAEELRRFRESGKVAVDRARFVALTRIKHGEPSKSGGVVETIIEAGQSVPKDLVPKLQRGVHYVVTADTLGGV